MRLQKMLKTICVVVLLISSSAQAQTFNAAVNPRGTGTTTYANNGTGLDINIINNRPAIVFGREANAGIDMNGDEYPAFYIADDATGTSWSSEVIIDNTVDFFLKSVALLEANGRPGVFYKDETGSDKLYFKRADNDTGSSWTGTRHLLYTGNSIHYIYAKSIKGKPAAIFVRDSSPDTVFFVRALDSNGNGWASPVAISSASNNLYVYGLTTIGDKPAISFFDSDNDVLYYAIASNDTGSAWNTPVAVYTLSTNAAIFSSIAEVSGRPAIAFINTNGSDTISYIRADNATGSSWPSSVTTVYAPSSSWGSHIQLGVAVDTPVIFFEWLGGNDNFWVKANNTTGSAWGSPVAFNAGNDCDGLAMVIDGNNVHLAYVEIGGDSIGYIYGNAPYNTNPTWDSVGIKGFSADAAYYTSLAIDDGGTLYLAYKDGANSNKTTVKKHDGSSWSTVGTEGFSVAAADYTTIALDTNGVPYVAYRDNNGFKLTVKKYDGSSWVTVGTAAFSAGDVQNISMKFDSNNTPYVAYVDKGNSNKATVMKYIASSWVPVGTAGLSAGTADFPYLSIDNNDTPYIAYQDGGNSFKATVMKFNGSNWVAVGGAGFTSSNASRTGLVFDSNNNPFVSFSDKSNSYKATVMTYNGSSWAIVGSAGFSAALPYDMEIKIDNNDTVYVAYRDAGNSNKATVMKYNGSSWEAVGSAGFTPDRVYSPSLVIDNGTPYVAYGDDNNGVKATVMKYDTPVNTWDGSKWSLGTPTATSNACIESNTAPTTFTCKNVTISNGFSLNTGTSEVVTINGDLLNNGNGVTGTGTIKFSNEGTSRVKGDTIAHEGTVIVESGCTLNTNDKLRLTSGASNTGRIGESAGTITGNVMAQRYSIGKRCYRLYAHPFSSSIALNQLTDEIDITGAGGTTNGFTGTASNAPSAYWFDPTAADTSASSVNSGWKAFTSANTASWDRHELLLLFLRGSKGEGLNGQAYTPSASTFEAAGVVNQGQQVVSLTKGSNTTFAAVGNPFPSGVQMNTITLGANVGTNYYAWDASVGADGAYVTNPFTLSYILPAYAGFFTNISATTTITFEESDKAGGGQALHKTTAPANMVELLISDSSTKWDRLLISLDANAMDVEDKQDAKKLYNPNLDFYTLSKDGARLAVDVRPYADQNSIPLGLTAYNRYNKYVIKTGMFDIPAGTKLVLHDKYLNKTEELKAGTEYWFDVTADSLSQGDQRFEINMVGKPTTNIIEATERRAQMQLIPNPAHNQVKVSFDKIQGEAQITMMSVTGQLVYQQAMNTKTGSVTIPLANVANGIYIVELQSKNARFTEKLIKE